MILSDVLLQGDPIIITPHRPMGEGEVTLFGKMTVLELKEENVIDFNVYSLHVSYSENDDEYQLSFKLVKR